MSELIQSSDEENSGSQKPLFEKLLKDNPRQIEPKLTGIQRIGFRLSIYVLAISVLFIIGICLFILFSELDATNRILESGSFNEKQAILLIQEKKEYRTFLTSTIQIVLINFLLPILTAILGYIFGTRNEQN